MGKFDDIKRNPDGSIDASNLPDSFNKIPEHRLLKNRTATISTYNNKVQSSKIKSLGEIKPEVVLDPKSELIGTQVSLEAWMEKKGILAWVISASKVLPEKSWKKIFALYLDILEQDQFFDKENDCSFREFRENIEKYLSGIVNHVETKGGDKTALEKSVEFMKDSIASSDFLDKISGMTDDEIREQMITLEDSIKIKSEDPDFYPPRSIDDYAVLNEEDLMVESEDDEVWQDFFKELYQYSSEYSDPFKTLTSSLESDINELKDKFDTIQQIIYMEGDERIQGKYNNILQKITNISKEINEFNYSIARNLSKNDEDIS